MSFVFSQAPEFEAANEQYSATFNKGHLALPPARLADPAKLLGLEEGDAPVIRNAGGRALDAISSLIISQQLLGTREIVLVHHTYCGMLTFSDDSLRQKIRSELEQDADHIAFLWFRDLEASVLDDMRRIEQEPSLLIVPITGYIYHAENRKMTKVKWV
ncbi:beta-class carbonic anhydrase [Aspergillus stella-maris]|uniref:beta-class carbonic anhydrase n=1 Tax=Aspergillus stella-maris TaxID=1810926 RepID=UPI003CCD8C74